MPTDLSLRHDLVGDLLQLPKTKSDWEKYRLTDEQVAFYHEQGYLKGIRILTDEQIEKLRTELAEFFNPQHEGHELWYEYHTNESSRPDTVLFHALGAWRIRPGFHDILWHPAFTVAAYTMPLPVSCATSSTVRRKRSSSSASCSTANCRLSR